MGSIKPYETAKGRRYVVQYRKPDRTSTSKRGFRKKREAELYLASTEVRKATGEWTLDTYADLFDDDLDAVAVALNDARRASNAVVREVAHLGAATPLIR